MYTAVSYNVIRDKFVLFIFAKVEVIWFDTLVSGHSLALLHVLHINSVSHQTFGLGLKFETLVSAKDEVNKYLSIIIARSCVRASDYLCCLVFWLR